jgi:hypothetical protein
VSRAERRIPDHRHDRARDDVPFAVHRNGNYGLDVEDILRPLLRAEVEIRVVLERQADEVADGFCASFASFLGVNSAQTDVANIAASAATGKARARSDFMSLSGFVS